MSGQPDEDRLTELETRLAFQDAALQDLNQVVTDLQRQLDLMEGMLRNLQQQLQEMAELQTEDAGNEPPPPHY